MALALTLAILVGTDRVAPLQAFATDLPHHFAGAWSIELARLLLNATQPRHASLVALALGFDGVFTIVEGWALRRRHAWGPWLVVASTSSLLPFEILALMHKVRWGRVFILVVNLWILGYLVWRRLRSRI